MKAITIEKGKVAFYSSLSADTLVVNGVLKVNGTLRVPFTRSEEHTSELQSP